VSQPERFGRINRQIGVIHDEKKKAGGEGGKDVGAKMPMKRAGLEKGDRGGKLIICSIRKNRPRAST